MKTPERMSREELEEEVAYLRHELAIEIDASELAAVRKGGLTTAEARLVIALRRSMPRVVSKIRLFEMMAPETPEREANVKIVDVYICRIRKILGPGVIETFWGSGVRLTAKGALTVDALAGVRSCITAQDAAA